MKKEQGFSLLEVVISLFVLTVGILGVAVMQIQAVNANNSSMTRTVANVIARSFIEELKRVSYDDPTLVDTDGDEDAGLNDGSDIGGGAINPALADHQFVPADFPSFANSYNLVGGNLVDSTGRQFQVFWNVDQNPLDLGPPAPAPSDSPFCTINFFIYWQTPLGQNHLQYTTTRYNNQSI